MTSKLTLIWSALAPFKKQAALLFLVMVCAAVSEAVGIGMIIPLLAVLLGNAPAQGSESRALSQFEELLRSLFTPDTLLLGIALIIVAVYLCKTALVILRAFLSIRFVNMLRRYWMAGVLERYLFSDYSHVVSQERGILLNNVTQEPTNAGKALHRALEYSSELTVSLGIYTVMLVVDWRITTILTVAAAMILAVLWGVSHRYSLSVGRETLLLNQSLMARAEESLHALREVKAFGLEHDILHLFTKRIDVLLGMVLKFRTYLEMPVPLAECVVVLFLVAGLLYAGYGSGGSAVAMIPVLGFFAVAAQKVYRIMSTVFSGSMSLFSFLPSLELVHNLMCDHIPHRREAGVVIEKIEGDIVFEEVSYFYPKAGESVLERLSLRIPRGKVVGIVGKSGAGKSTLADLLCGLYPGYEGRIRVGEYELRDIDPQAWKNLIGLVTQEPFIFNATIRENILLGCPDASEEEMVGAARKAHAHEFISLLSHGYDTVVADQGALSVGQKQRITIARAILRDPELFIFDEATSALDPETEKYIQTFIESLGGRKTVVFITHRYNSIENADIVYVLDHGRIVDSGLYRDLKSVTRAGASAGDGK